MKLRSIIVDDSSMQRMAIARLVNNHPNLAMIAGYSNAIEAINGIKNHEVDLIFLDVEMPIINGFDLLESLDNPPQVILITGNPEYALKAFDYDVTDYLQKPITLARFDSSVKRAMAKCERAQRMSEEDVYIFVKSSLKKHKVVINDIMWIEGLGDYIKLVTNEGNIVILSTMKSFEKQLPKYKFLRIHKSYIVNLERIEKFNRKNVEVEGRQVPVSRRKKIELMEALNNI
ncbi:LytR/AlgR family response regulator transcription factor [Arenibacter algicola]|uniref:LytR/AlgR family response regulator transcription factor n=1 Tax=Arenibacter algicola TaxID=616991 RepID=UPI0004DEEF5E|nr:LytTR family DNA-binding domain-containing protein [Arenibacter algicola]